MQQDHLAYLKSQKQQEVLERDRANKRVGKMVVDDDESIESSENEDTRTDMEDAGK